MDRRRFLAASALAATGFATSAFSRLSGMENLHLAMGQSITAQPGGYFTESERRLVSAIAEVILPRTDTPGATDAGVPAFIEYMVEQWLTESEQKIFHAGLHAAAALASKEFGQPFEQLSADHQTEVLEALESEALDTPWYNFGNVQRTFIEDAPFICQIKELTIFGFFSSEVGAKEVLRHNPMPMTFDGDLPLERDDATWSTIRVM